jgi:hypothetical protein
LQQKHVSHLSAQNVFQSSVIPDPMGPTSHHSHQPTTANIHQLGHQPPRQRLDDSNTEHQTEEIINCVRAFNPNFSFEYLLQSISVILLQFMQYPYEIAIPIILNTFLANHLRLNA